MINEGRQKTIEISHNVETIDNGLGTSFVRIRMVGEKHFIPINKISELKNELLRLNIFQVEKDYPSMSMEGLTGNYRLDLMEKRLARKGILIILQDGEKLLMPLKIV